MIETAHTAARPLTARPPFEWDADAEGSLVALSLHRAGIAFRIEEWREYARAWVEAHAAAVASQGVAQVALELNSHQECDEYVSLARTVCETILTSYPRSEDGLLLSAGDAREVVVDSLFYSAPLLAHAGKVLNDKRFSDDAAHQLFGYSSHAHDAVTHLFFHCWNPFQMSSNEVAWARGNGWIANALVDTIEYLSVDHRRRRALHLVLTYLVAALESHQNSDGFWSVIMDDDTTPIETSATALIAAALARGIKNGSVESHLSEIVSLAWNAVESQIGMDGLVSNVKDSAGCGDAEYYADLATGNYSWGNASVLLAAAEIQSLINKGV